MLDGRYRRRSSKWVIFCGAVALHAHIDVIVLPALERYWLYRITSLQKGVTIRRRSVEGLGFNRRCWTRARLIWVILRMNIVRKARSPMLIDWELIRIYLLESIWYKIIIHIAWSEAVRGIQREADRR